MTTTYTLDTARGLAQVLSETTGGQTTRYLHGLDLIAQSDGATTEYLAYDGFGSVRQLVDGSGAVLTSQTFDPYGTPYSVDEQADSSFGWTGEQVDENGLVYLRARYYNPAQGRFMQVDPSRMEKNGYQYAGSSPTMYSDPSGNCVDLGELMAFMPPFAARAPSVGKLWEECKANWSTFWNVASNPDNDFNNIAHSFTYYVNPLGIQSRNMWQGMAEFASANSRWVGAGGYGQWLGKVELFGIAPGRWLGWGADTSSYYQDPEHPYRYVEDFGTIFGPTYSAGLTTAFFAYGGFRVAENATWNSIARGIRSINIESGATGSPPSLIFMPYDPETIGVNSAAFARDVELSQLNPGAPIVEPSTGEYYLNRTRLNLNESLATGKIEITNYEQLRLTGGKTLTGRFMYVITEDGQIIIGQRAGMRMPHPTLIGGQNPRVLGAGMVEMQSGKIISIDNASGHFQPPTESMWSVYDAFEQLAQQYPGIFSKFKGYLIWDGAPWVPE